MTRVADRDTPCPHCGAVLTEPVREACGSCRGSLIVCGRFRLGVLIGRGSSGAVYAATCVDDGELAFAVKVRSLAGRGSWGAHDRFERSARWLAGLAHPGLPRVHAFESMGQGGRAFLVLDRFAGGTLQARVHGARARLDDASARALLRGLLEALSALHAHAPPLVHRDVTPYNVMFRDESFAQPVLVDCDALAEEGQHDPTTLVGTPGYLAPEQIAGSATPASDVYSAAATVLFAVTGLDVDGHRRRGGRVEPPAALSPQLRALLAAMLATDPRARPVNAREALRLLDGAPATARPRRSALATVASVALGVTALGAVPWQGASAERGEHEDPTAPSECRIRSIPTGATVYVGDRDVPWTAERPLDVVLGTTPIVVSRAERRPLVLHRAGFRPYVVEVDAPGGDSECAFTARLTPQ